MVVCSIPVVPVYVDPSTILGEYGAVAVGQSLDYPIRVISYQSSNTNAVPFLWPGRMPALGKKGHAGHCPIFPTRGLDLCSLVDTSVDLNSLDATCNCFCIYDLILVRLVYFLYLHRTTNL